MTVFTSATRTVSRSDESFYVGSEGWGQPPASHHVIDIQGGQHADEEPQASTIYVATGPAAAVPDAELQAEFAAWDRASDEALLDFEAGLD